MQSLTRFSNNTVPAGASTSDNIVYLGEKSFQTEVLQLQFDVAKYAHNNGISTFETNRAYQTSLSVDRYLKAYELKKLDDIAPEQVTSLVTAAYQKNPTAIQEMNLQAAVQDSLQDPRKLAQIIADMDPQHVSYRLSIAPDAVKPENKPLAVPAP